MKKGVLLGSVLMSILFTLYINDLVVELHDIAKVYVYAYADDIMVQFQDI